MNVPWKDVIDICGLGDGWKGLAESLLKEIEVVYQMHDLKMEDDLVIEDIREKMGELYVYTKSSLKEVDELTEKYRIQSRQICEDCGSPERMYNQGSYHISTLCRKCAGLEELE